MDKLTAIKIKYNDGTYSDEIPVSVLAENVEYDNSHTLADVLGNIDISNKGSIQNQINQLSSSVATDNGIIENLGDDLTIVRNSIGLIEFWGADREISPYGYTVSKHKNMVKINGIGDGTTGRWKMTGNFIYAGSKATSEGWDKELYLPAGRYTFALTLTSGSNETNNEVFIRVFDTSSTQLLQVNIGEAKTYDFVGGNILVTLTTGSGTYINAIYTVDIYSHLVTKGLRESVNNEILKRTDTIFTVDGIKKLYTEKGLNNDFYIKAEGTWFLRGGIHNNTNYSSILLDHRATSPKGITDCIYLPLNYGIAFNTDTNEYDYVYNRTPSENHVIIFMNSYAYNVSGLATQNYFENQIAKIQASILTDIDFEVPSYFENQLTTKITRIQNNINEGKTNGVTPDIEAFIFITDPHWNDNKQHSPALIKRITDSAAIQSIFCGGDIVYYRELTKEAVINEIKSFNNAMMTCCREYHCVFGNHDDNSNGNNSNNLRFTKEEQFNLLYPQAFNSNVHWAYEESVDLSKPYKNDYYVDHPNTKTRFLCLDWNNGDLTARGNWITSVLSRKDGYRVVIIYHGFYANDGSDGLTEEHTNFLNVFAPYRNKIVAMFTGHVHFDAVVDYYQDGKAPIIITACDRFRDSIGMIEGTDTEQCFDVVVINYVTSTIHLTRIGNGQDRDITFALSNISSEDAIYNLTSQEANNLANMFLEEENI